VKRKAHCWSCHKIEVDEDSDLDDLGWKWISGPGMYMCLCPRCVESLDPPEKYSERLVKFSKINYTKKRKRSKT